MKQSLARGLKPRPTIVFVSMMVGVLLLGSRGLGQAPASRSIIQRSALPAIDVGLIVDDPRAPRQTRGRSLRGDALDRTGVGGRPYLADRVLVKFRGTASAATRLGALRAATRTGTIVARPSHTNFDEVRIEVVEDAEAVAGTLRRHAAVEYAQPAYRAETRFVPNDPFYADLQWNFRAIDLERAWDIQRGADSSLIVAVIDTGMAYRDAIGRFFAGPFPYEGRNYPALGTIDVPFARATDLAVPGSAGDSRFVAPRNFIWDTNEPLDLDGHGTHVSGTLAGLTNNSLGVAGIAFNVRLMPVKVISTEWDDIFDSPHFGSDQTVAQGIRYAADNGAKILNLSIGRSGEARSAPAVEDAIRYAVSRGCFVAIAGGNGFEEGNELEVYAEIASRVDGAVSVSATDRARHRASYSTTGAWIELAAPGGSLAGFGITGLVHQQTYDPSQTDTFNLSPAAFRPPRFDVLAIRGFAGTSMSTPHVSGVAALLMRQGYTSPAAIEATLKRFASDLGSPGRDNEFGFGEVSARATLRGLGLAK